MRKCGGPYTYVEASRTYVMSLMTYETVVLRFYIDVNRVKSFFKIVSRMLKFAFCKFEAISGAIGARELKIDLKAHNFCVSSF